MSDGFSLEGYHELLSNFADLGYQAVSYDRSRPDAAHLILRHDIDMSIDAAVEMAEVEAAAGVASHYFVLLRSELYNPFSKNGLKGLRRILTLGHDVGLHFDASLYGNSEVELDEAAERECSVLEHMLDRRVTVITFHRPAKALLNRAAPLARRLHGYQPRFFRDIGYCSDSRGGWHHDHPLAHTSVAKKTALQLLTHPIWWIGHGDPIDKLNSFVDRHDLAAREWLADNSEPYRRARNTTAGSTNREGTNS